MSTKGNSSTARIAVVIPTLNRAHYLREALDSVRRVEAGLPDATLELIVIDDGSTDHTWQMCEGMGVRIVRNQGKGLPSGRNTGIRLTKSEYLAFLDDDDVWLPEHLREHLELLDAKPEVALAFSRAYLTNQDLADRNGPYPPLPLLWEMVSACSIGETMNARLARRRTGADRALEHRRGKC